MSFSTKQCLKCKHYRDIAWAMERASISDTILREGRVATMRGTSELLGICLAMSGGFHMRDQTLPSGWYLSEHEHCDGLRFTQKDGLCYELDWRIT